MKRIIAIILVVSLVFLNLHYQIEEASADMPADTSAIYWYDMWDTLDSFIGSNYQTQFNNIGSLVETYKNNQNFNIMGLAEPTNNNYAFIFVRNESIDGTEHGFYFDMWNSNGSIVTSIRGYIGSGGRTYFRTLGYIAIHNGNVVACTTFNTVDGAFGNYVSTYNFASNNVSHCIPTYNDWQISGRYTYSLRPIQKYTTSEYDYSMASNISMEPIIVPYQIVVFWLFGRKYLSTINQRFMIQLDPEKNYNLMQISGIDESADSFVFNMTYDSVLCLGDVATLTGVGFEETSPLGIYAIDITNYGWQTILSCTLCWSENDEVEILAQASNVPYPVPGNNENDILADILNNWNDYTDSYPTNSIVPSDLADTLYGWLGSNTAPCVLQVPSDLYDRQTDNPVTSGIGHFSYALNENVSPWISGYNLELMNICIIPRDRLLVDVDNYRIKNWTNSSDPDNEELVGYLSLAELYQSFDMIILVPNSQGIMQEIVDTLTTYTAYTGYHSLGSTISGIQYVSDIDTLSGNLMYGYVILTRSAYQKQMLYNFNDGISSMYDLMSDFCTKFDLWQTAFFKWTVTFNTQINSLNGTLGNIYSLLLMWDIGSKLDSIVANLEQIAYNTDEAIHDYWILPVYEFLLQFQPSLDGFGHWIDSIEEFGDNAPALPGLTVAPLPTLSVTPIPIPGG